MDTDLANQEKEDEEDGLGSAPYYVPQSRSLSRLSKLDTYRVSFVALLSLLCPDNGRSDSPSRISLTSFPCQGRSFVIECGGIPADDPGCRQQRKIKTPSSQRGHNSHFSLMHVWVTCRLFGLLALG